MEETELFAARIFAALPQGLGFGVLATKVEAGFV